MGLTVLLNARAGSVVGSPDEQGQRIGEAFRRAGVAPEICFVEPDKLTETARAAAKAGEIVVGAGGDGTLLSVAQGVLGTSAAFAVLPVGTFNHLAKELEMPLEVELAAEAIARGERQSLPVPTVNGRAFLSYAAIGLYARAIRHREAQRTALQRSKLHGMIVALLRIIRQPPYRRLRLQIGGAVIRRFTSSLFVVCNEYEMQAMGLAEPFELDRTQLNVCVGRSGTRWQVIQFMLAALFGRAHRAMEVITAPAVTVHTHHRMESAILDGEVTTLASPLQFAMSPTPLTIIVPPVELRQKPTQAIIKRS